MVNCSHAPSTEIRRECMEIPRHARRFLAWLILPVVAVVIAAAVGCGGDQLPLVDAGGTVTYRGEPVSGANVLFVPDGGANPAVGRTGDQGEFTLAVQGRQGAVPGAYKVAITAAEYTREVSDAEFDEMNDAQIDAMTLWHVPKEYANVRSSNLTATVSEDPEENDFTFDLN